MQTQESKEKKQTPCRERQQKRRRMDRNGYWQDTEDPLEKKMRQLQTIQNQKKLCQEQLETTLTQIAETKKAISVQKKESILFSIRLLWKL